MLEMGFELHSNFENIIVLFNKSIVFVKSKFLLYYILREKIS